ncbi:MAG TPA: nuclear transport factor 2 family protein [Ramlibacter sp.]|nr:nuclear transport factor 2 family protein [Ramlibacter sp.]
MAITAIQETMQMYFDVMHECDLEKFDQVFHPTCSLFSAQDGAFTVRPFAHYRAEMAVRTPPKSLGLPRDEAILKIDLLSAEIALAQVRVRIFEKIFIDNLNLLKLDGRWMIVAKLYHHAATVA